MKKWLKIVFISSLVLNIVTIAGFILYRNFARNSTAKLLVISTEDKVALEKNILEELQSGEPNRIENMKDTLRRRLEIDKKIAEDAKQFVK